MSAQPKYCCADPYGKYESGISNGNPHIARLQSVAYADDLLVCGILAIAREEHVKHFPHVRNAMWDSLRQADSYDELQDCRCPETFEEHPPEARGQLQTLSPVDVSLGIGFVPQTNDYKVVRLNMIARNLDGVSLFSPQIEKTADEFSKSIDGL
ncbi:hypothetical protein RHSIM_Rhsim05G0026800 [Rhododendron simsii]|uniref:Uncharacterized protein n=1 Tax=Rhododendron simsii TaxID=118357 RepID=A0A834H1H9_RHOSS|nr:hypothetical protein RHSIM_Rhsim05G0026800 [Rhododendron simsii]